MPDAPAAAPAATDKSTPSATPPVDDKKIVNTAIARLTGRTPDAAPPAEAAKPAAEPAPAASAPSPEKKEEGKPGEAPQEKPKSEATVDRIRKVAAKPAAQPVMPSADEIAAAVAAKLPAPKTEDPPKSTPAPVLAPEDKQELELAEFAAEHKKDKYSDLPSRLTGWFKKRDEFLSTKAAELGGADSPDFREFLEGEEYKNFLRANRPGYQRGDRSEIERARINAEADRRAAEKIRETEQKLQREIDRVKLAPVIERTVNEAVGELLEVEDEVVKAYSADPSTALKTHKIEAQEVEQTAVGLRLATEEYLQIHHGLKDPSADNPLHDFLGRFLVEQGRLLDSKPEAERTRDGLVLVSPQRFAQLDKEGKAAGYATFSDRDVVKMLVTFSKSTLPSRLQGIRKDIESSGYTRVAASTDTKKDDDETSTPSPKATTSRAPGPSETPPSSVPRHIALLTGRKS